MKHLTLILLLIPLLIGACRHADEDQDQENVQKAFRRNGYNFTNYQKTGYRSIKFKLPKAFEYDYGGGHTYKRNALLRRHYQLGVLFTVERFDNYDIQSDLMNDYLIDDDLLNGFHDAYAERRYNSLEEASISYKKVTKKNVRFNGVTQMIGGSTSEYADTYYYAMATLKVDKEYYVFQLITSPDMMAYVHDDFERILATVRRK